MVWKKKNNGKNTIVYFKYKAQEYYSILSAIYWHGSISTKNIFMTEFIENKYKEIN